MTTYYLIADRLPETPELPFSWRFGTYDDDNPAPKGAELFKTKRLRNAAITKLEKENEKSIELSASDELFKVQEPKKVAVLLNRDSRGRFIRSRN